MALHLFSPRVFDPAIFDTAPIRMAAPRIDVVLNGATDEASMVWTSLMPDVLVDPAIVATRGIPGNGPADRVCTSGTLTFTLDNGASNSAHTPSYYSPTHPNCRVGWQEGCPIRLVAVFGQRGDYPLWRGRIRTIDPTPGRTPMRAAVLAQDAAADLATAIVPTIPPQINKSEVELLQAVIDALPDTAKPPVLFDTAVDTYQFGFDNAGDNANALSLITDATISALGTAFIDALGRLRYRNRQTQAGMQSSLVIGDADLLYSGPGFAGGSSLANVYNHFRLTVHPKTETPAIDLFTSDAAIEVDPGTPVEVWDNYSDPDNPDRLIGGFNFAPIAPSDYDAKNAADGSGPDRASDLQIVVQPFVASAKTTLTNISATPLFVVMRQLRGTGIFDNAPVTLEAVLAKPYGDRVANLDLRFQDDAPLAQNLANYLLAQYADRARAGEELVYLPSRSIALLVGAITIDIGDVVTASEQTSGVSNVDYEVRGVTHTFRQLGHGDTLLTVRYRIVPHAKGGGTANAWTFDHPTFGLLDTGTVFGFA